MTKKKFILIATSGVVTVALIAASIYIGLRTPTPDELSKDGSIPAQSEISINVPEVDNTSIDVNTEEPKPTGININVGDNSGSNAISSQTGEKAKDGATPAKTKTPSQPTNDNNEGKINIGNEAPPADNNETDAFIKNLEIQGCPYCGSHTCESFYAKDEWGNPCYTPSKCPKYDITKDPVYYCQTCHKKCGDGSNGTCVQFVNACYCPICGKWVPARTCHTCE